MSEDVSRAMDTGYQSPWEKGRRTWVRSVSDADLLAVIAEVAKRGRTDDEVSGAPMETSETILWLATRGKRGREWGIAAEPARRLGLWTGG